MAECQWFHLCHNESVGIAMHPTLNGVDICQDHLDWLMIGFSPTKMIPPMVARKLVELENMS